jgi:hypothetical protein
LLISVSPPEIYGSPYLNGKCAARKTDWDEWPELGVRVTGS